MIKDNDRSSYSKYHDESNTLIHQLRHNLTKDEQLLSNSIESLHDIMNVILDYRSVWMLTVEFSLNDYHEPHSAYLVTQFSGQDWLNIFQQYEASLNKLSSLSIKERQMLALMILKFKLCDDAATAQSQLSDSELRYYVFSLAPRYANLKDAELSHRLKMYYKVELHYQTLFETFNLKVTDLVDEHNRRTSHQDHDNERRHFEAVFGRLDSLVNEEKDVYETNRD